MSFCAVLCWILGRIREAREEAFDDAVPGCECSARMVVPWAMQELWGALGQMAVPAVAGGRRDCRAAGTAEPRGSRGDGGVLTIAGELRRRPWCRWSSGGGAEEE